MDHETKIEFAAGHSSNPDELTMLFDRRLQEHRVRRVSDPVITPSLVADGDGEAWIVKARVAAIDTLSRTSAPRRDG